MQGVVGTLKCVVKTLSLIFILLFINDLLFLSYKNNTHTHTIFLKKNKDVGVLYGLYLSEFLALVLNLGCVIVLTWMLVSPDLEFSTSNMFKMVSL